MNAYTRPWLAAPVPLDQFPPGSLFRRQEGNDHATVKTRPLNLNIAPLQASAATLILIIKSAAISMPTAKKNQARKKV